MEGRDLVLAILSAMPDEIAAIVESLDDVTTRKLGSRQYHAGKLQGTPVVAVFSGWGKVAAAATTTQLIASYDVTDLVFTGVAGAVQHGLSIGDVVVGTGSQRPAAMYDGRNRGYFRLQGFLFRNRPIGWLHAPVCPLMPAMPQTGNDHPHEKYGTSVDRWHTLKYEP